MGTSRGSVLSFRLFLLYHLMSVQQRAREGGTILGYLLKTVGPGLVLSSRVLQPLTSLNSPIDQTQDTTNHLLPHLVAPPACLASSYRVV